MQTTPENDWDAFEAMARQSRQQASVNIEADVVGTIEIDATEYDGGAVFIQGKVCGQWFGEDDLAAQFGSEWLEDVREIAREELDSGTYVYQGRLL